MTRRRFVLANQATQKLYASPEFNGSSEEYTARGACLDTCDISAFELKKLFQVGSFDAFSKACEVAQSHYHSFMDRRTPFPPVEVSPDHLRGLQADEIIFIINGELVCATPGWDGSISSLCAHLDNMVKIAQALIAPSNREESCILQYEQVLKLPNQELATIQKYLHVTREEDYQGKDNTITHTVQFPDGMQMDIKCCGSQDGPSWTEAVLFDSYGQELTFAEVRENYMGSWELQYGGIKYSVFVTNTGNILQLDSIQTGVIDMEGICPVCGAEIEYCDSHEMTDDGGLIPWECPSCKATGKEGYNRVFDQHYDVCSENGEPIPDRER